MGARQHPPQLCCCSGVGQQRQNMVMQGACRWQTKVLCCRHLSSLLLQGTHSWVFQQTLLWGPRQETLDWGPRQESLDRCSALASASRAPLTEVRPSVPSRAGSLAGTAVLSVSRNVSGTSCYWMKLDVSLWLFRIVFLHLYCSGLLNSRVDACQIVYQITYRQVNRD